jgi:signal peptidase I
MSYSRYVSVVAVLLGLVTLLVVLRTEAMEVGIYPRSITSTSMQPALPVGSLVLVQKQSAESYRVGDVVTFQMPGVGRVTHRIASIEQEQGGYWATTKGDAVANSDPYPMALADAEGKVQMSLPFLGYAWILLHTRGGFALVVILTGYWLLIVLGSLTADGRWIWPASWRIRKIV